MNEDTSIAVSIIAAVAALTAICFLIGLTTHASHVAEVRVNHDETVACIQSDRTAADCRLIVYGSR